MNRFNLIFSLFILKVLLSKEIISSIKLSKNLSNIVLILNIMQIYSVNLNLNSSKLREIIYQVITIIFNIILITSIFCIQ